MTPLDIEYATIAAWPARTTETLHGWRLLAAGGVTGRVNAAWPLEWTGGDIGAAIVDVEGWYARRGLPARFKLTDGAVAPADLPQALAARGYAPTMHTLVMISPLGSRETGDALLFEAMPAAFDAALVESTPNPDELAERRDIARRAPNPAAFALIELNARPAAIGMTALADSLAGVFLMRTIPDARRCGLARRILRTLLGRAHALGARNAFLQVEADNAAAIGLYESEGFTTLTSYRFWRKAT
jgi:ribosomal protein S18 acetylase RimI-like enzyme